MALQLVNDRQWVGLMKAPPWLVSVPPQLNCLSHLHATSNNFYWDGVCVLTNVSNEFHLVVSNWKFCANGNESLTGGKILHLSENLATTQLEALLRSVSLRRLGYGNLRETIGLSYWTESCCSVPHVFKWATLNQEGLNIWTKRCTIQNRVLIGCRSTALGISKFRSLLLFEIILLIGIEQLKYRDFIWLVWDGLIYN